MESITPQYISTLHLDPGIAEENKMKRVRLGDMLSCTAVILFSHRPLNPRRVLHRFVVRSITVSDYNLNGRIKGFILN
jgi:hypothetical protein